MLIKYGKNKWDHAGIYNALGWHIESWEGIIKNAHREIYEESWLDADKIELKWIVHCSGFFGKDYMMYIMKGSVDHDSEVVSDEWVGQRFSREEAAQLNTYEDVTIFRDKLLTMKEGELFTAVSEFDNDTMIKLEFE